jgi:hypothetical protein
MREHEYSPANFCGRGENFKEELTKRRWILQGAQSLDEAELSGYVSGRYIMSLQAFCQKRVVTISPERSIAEACWIMKDKSVGCVRRREPWQAVWHSDGSGYRA